MRKRPLMAAEEVLEIIRRRYERTSTLVTSNRLVEGGRKQAEIEREARVQLVNDLPRRETSLVRVGASQVEVELIERGFGEELRAAAEGLQVIELVFDQPVDGFDVALIGVSGGRDAIVLGAEVSDGGREVAAGTVRL
jgi:hypothetical protein